MSDNTKSRLTGLLLLAVGIGLAAINLNRLRAEGRYGLKSTFLSAPAMVLGLGMIIHGRSADATVLTPLSRAYGMFGCAIGALVLYRLGFFSSGIGMPEYLLVAFTLGIWLLPRRVLRPGQS